MPLPEFLYRLTTENKVQFNEQDLLISHYGDPLVSLAEEGDIEAIARYFFFHRILALPQHFIVLKVLAEEIHNRTTRTSPFFKSVEHNGHVPRTAIKHVLQGSWISSSEVDVSETFKTHPIGKKILQRTGWNKPIVEDVLTEEEIARILKR
jgi:hypothetical protein